jgi:hypothetical protein
LVVFGRPRRRALPATREPAEWEDWVADNMQQRERGLSPHEESSPSALILIPLLGVPALLVVGTILVFLLK